MLLMRNILVSSAICAAWCTGLFTFPDRPGRLRAAPAVPRDASSRNQVGVSSQDTSRDRRKLMRRKLERTQEILNGIAIQDFDQISEQARLLAADVDNKLWEDLRTPDYRLYRSELEQIALAIEKAGREKDADAAASAYVRLTVNCLHCHQHVRKHRRAMAD